MTRRARATSILLLATLVIFFISAVALAADEGDGSGGAEEVTTTTVGSGLTPAVEVANNESAPAEADWTYRYMIPAALVLAAVIVLITAIKYFTDVVRRRYRIVE